MRSSRIGALLGTVTFAAVLLAAVSLSTLFIARNQEVNHPDLNNSSVVQRLPSTDSVELVKPLKLRPRLHERDILYLIENNIPLPTDDQHHSGHFREQMAEIWDPHPEYEFTGFGRQFHLQLAQSQTPFILPGIKVVYVWGNRTEQLEDSQIRLEDCFYTGKVKDDPHSMVTVNLCNGMTGHIRTSDASYLIEPAEKWQGFAVPINHKMQKLPGTWLAPTDFEGEEKYKSRQRRSLSKEYYVELLVVADRTMVEYHGPSLKSYILNLVAIAAMVFKEPSIGNFMSLSVVKLFFLGDMDFRGPQSERTSVTSASEMLENFCRWQDHYNAPKDNSSTWKFYDAAVLLTRENICRIRGNASNCDTLGLAELGAMCSKSSCSLVKDFGLYAGFTIAHELGHLMGIPHDDDGKRCKPYMAEEAKRYVMSATYDNNAYSWGWSNCSRHFLTEFLDAGSGTCLLDFPDKEEKLPEHFPGEVFNANRQCELLYGKGFKECPHAAHSDCKKLSCASERNQTGCHSYHLPQADGTPCGKQKWCQQGHCVKIDRDSLGPIDGGWGPWLRYGECSRTCGGGVKKSIRNCDRPLPAHGGRYCIGQRVRYQSCSTQECPSGTQGFREQQCAEFNNNTLNIPSISKNVKWIPKYGGISDQEHCKLYCMVENSSAHYKLLDKVIDGTPCQPDRYDICINGICHPAGCDRQLNSSIDLDICGQCGGNNSSCERKEGYYNVSRYGYNTVVRIPAGSSNIDIRQISYNNNSKEDNVYIALMDSETNEYILNGNNIVGRRLKKFFYRGTLLEYSGSDSNEERINASRPLNKDLIVQVLAVGDIHPTQITYTYIVQRSVDKYEWDLEEDWTPCDKVCYGMRWREPKCVRVDTRVEAAKEMCNNLPQPDLLERECNTHCELRWEIAQGSECSSHCGPGERTLMFRCVKYDKKIGGTVQEHESACNHIPKPSDTEPCLGPCYKIGWRHGHWSPCSQTCGLGVRRRTVVCMDDLDRERDESECDESQRKAEEPCEIEVCPEWVYGEWSECSQTCGGGKRYRSISCKAGNRISNLCKEPKPKYWEECNAKPCPEWREIGQSECSVTCGIGAQTVKYECSVPNACPNVTKPINVKECKRAPCHNENSVKDNARYSWRAVWSKCSSTCGHGKRTKEFRCFDTVFEVMTDSSYCPKHNGNTVMTFDCYSECRKWRTDPWEPCSAICGEGYESRNVYCVGDNNTPIDDSYCADHEKPPHERKCKQHCPGQKDENQWSVGQWSKCSVSCGVGQQYRKVSCFNRVCMSPQPAKEQACKMPPCQEEGNWSYIDWLPCNVTCGHGYRHSVVKCKSLSGKILPDSACRTKKPAQLNSCYKSCNNNYFHPVLDDKPRWKARRWSTCSLASCTKSRTVYCSIGEQKVPDHACAHMRKLKTKRPCKRRCPGQHPYVWRPGKWSKCSVTCGKGFKRRAVICVKRGRQRKGLRKEPDSHCKGRKPLTETECYEQCEATKSVPEYVWVPEPWQPCINPCSVKGQERIIRCFNGDNEVSSKYCFKKGKPPRWRACEKLMCPSCQDLYNMISTRNPKDGDYEIYPRGRNYKIKVYCHGMETGRPKDYVTVNKPNFSMMYDPQITRPSPCSGSREAKVGYCSPNRIERNNVHPGFTTFKKIALNTTTLIVDTKDWTFANTLRGSPVPYGEAGDCFSTNCPQGQFKINLKGTGLTLSTDTIWIGQHGAKMEISRDEDHSWVEVTCGGCCGKCWPRDGIRLDLAPT